MSDVDLKESLAAVNWIVGRYGLDELLVDLKVGQLEAVVSDVDEAVVLAVKTFVEGPQSAKEEDEGSFKTKAFVRRLTTVVTKALEGITLEPSEREVVGETLNLLTDLLATN